MDWAGQTMSIKDQLTGEEIPVYIFVSALPCSQYAYVEGFLPMNAESWITAHIHAFKFYGGVPRVIVPDNLKTGVIKASKYEPVIHTGYQGMAEHYQTTIVPARVRHLKDKASAESTVGHISTWIIASLRNQEFFSLIELNNAVLEKLKEFNHKPFQKKQGSRHTAFKEEEHFALTPLPASTYEIASWRIATIIPLDVTMSAIVTPAVIDALDAYYQSSQNKIGLIVKPMVDYYYEFYKKTYPGISGSPLHDLLTFWAIMDQAEIRYKEVPLKIIVNRGEAFGQSIGDFRNIPLKNKKKYKTHKIAVQFNYSLFIKTFYEIMTNDTKKTL
ncbi:hypothetical protein NCCP133_33200 [Cytobacillus sp. NCCP-133]|nr:hypothetical protein NCCP133_33200 [Cytobacillus sp. NCCP-133]